MADNPESDYPEVLRGIGKARNVSSYELYVLNESAGLIERLMKPVPLETCPTCGGSAAILRVDKAVHVGCAQAFLRAMDGQKQCEKPPAMMGEDSEGAAIERWNAWVGERRGFF